MFARVWCGRLPQLGTRRLVLLKRLLFSPGVFGKNKGGAGQRHKIHPGFFCLEFLLPWAHPWLHSRPPDLLLPTQPQIRPPDPAELVSLTSTRCFFPCSSLSRRGLCCVRSTATSRAETHRGVSPKLRLLQPWPCMVISAFVAVNQTVVNAACPHGCRAGPKGLLCDASAATGLMTQISENLQTYLEKVPTCALVLGLCYLSWDQQDLQGILAGFQLRRKDTCPFLRRA